MIEDAGYRMLQMINLSLDLMKMERGSYPLQQVDVDLIDVLGKIAREAAPLAGAKGVELRVTVNGKPPANGFRFFVLGEELLCYSMVSNLVKNAVEASPTGRPVDIDLRKGPDAEIRIRNAGSVPEAVRERFFEKYVTAEKSGGTGLGTYSARLIAETQGGSVSLDASETGHTTITVRMPVPKEIEARDGTSDRSLPADDPGQPGVRLQDLDLPPIHVLVADDDPFGLEVLARRLAHPRISVDSAPNGREAVDRCAVKNYDLLFMDLEMPLLDGLGAVREIRSAEQAAGRRPSTIHALSAHDDETTRDRCLEAGCNGYLVKPVDDTHLVQVLVDMGLATPFDLPEAPRASSGSQNAAEAGAGGDPVVVVDADLEDLIPAFLDRKRDELRQIPPLVGNGEFESVRKIGHKLKGSFNIYGFSGPARLGAEIESAAVDRDVDRIRQLAAKTLDYLDRVTVTFESVDS
jgi:CheY-like chemotaxis protein